jgi:hypothetical protein
MVDFPETRPNDLWMFVKTLQQCLAECFEDEKNKKQSWFVDGFFLLSSLQFW